MTEPTTEETKEPIPRAPKYLRRKTKHWWNKLVNEWVFDDHHYTLLTGACELWDKAQEARELIEQDGLCIRDRFNQPKINPAVKVQRESWIAFMRILRELGLDAELPNEPRPPYLPIYQPKGKK